MLFTLLLQALAAPPATVLEHTLDVKVDWGRRLTTTQSWTVRIDDPDACVAGLIAPPGLDGAVDGSAMVLQDLFIVPETTAKGDVFTLSATRKQASGRHSGVFKTAPDLPVESASVRVTAQGNQPLTVWADPLGDPIWSTRRGKVANVSWSNLEASASGRLVWSTWSDWLEAGETFAKTVDAKIASKSELGRDLAGDLDASNLPEIARRTFQHVALDLGASGDFNTARSAAVVSESRTGTAAERAVVLLSMLRAAGYRAQPALLRRASAKGTFPITVPSPGMLDTPIVAVRDRAGAAFWIDPASDSVTVPAVPAALVGGTVWVPGDLPNRRVAPGVVDGTVTLTTSAKLTPSGDVGWQTDIAASGTGLEAIRTLLRSLDPKGQEQALRRLVQQARPDLERFAVTTSGTVDPFKPFTIHLSGNDTGVFTPHADGLRGTIVPVLASAMTAWLPPNIRVQELIDVLPPNTHTVAAHTRPGAAYDATAQIDRVVSKNGNRLRIDVDAIRPYSASSTAMDAGASIFLGKTAAVGVDMVLFPPASKAIVKSVDTLDLPLADRRALQALLWWSVDNDKAAQKALKKAMKTVTAMELLEPMSGWVAPGDDRPWRALNNLLPAEDRMAQLTLIEAIQDTNPALALELATPLMQYGEPTVAVRALLIGMAHAPTQDRRNSLATRLELDDPVLLQRAKLALAEFDIDHGQDAAQTTEALEPTTTRARMVRLAGVASSLPRWSLRDVVAALRSEAPHDPHVARRGAQILGNTGFHAEALDAALDAARVAHSDPTSWTRVADRASRAGNLQLALEAGRRASDQAPTDAPIAAIFHHLAILAVNEEAEAQARERNPALTRGDWPPSLDDLTAIAAQHELLAVLQFHEDAVSASPPLLALRAQLRRDAGFADEAARDSINLQRIHGEPQGSALAFSSTAGRVFGTGAISLLDDVSDPTAQLTRLDYRLITGSGDARADARALRDEPRAQDVLLAIGSPDDAAAKAEGWPSDLVQVRMSAPRGYRLNPVLSATKGVNAFSHADRQLAIVVINGPTAVLPPPLSALFTLDAVPLLVDDDLELLELRDGYVPLFAARRTTDTTTLGLGFTPEAARRALRDAQ